MTLSVPVEVWWRVVKKSTEHNLCCILSVFITTQGTYCYTSHQKDEAMVKCLQVSCFKRTQCHDQDSNPLSADQIHQRMSSVLLTTRPWHPMECSEYSEDVVVQLPKSRDHEEEYSALDLGSCLVQSLDSVTEAQNSAFEI